MVRTHSSTAPHHAQHEGPFLLPCGDFGGERDCSADEPPQNAGDLRGRPRAVAFCFFQTDFKPEGEAKLRPKVAKTYAQVDLIER